MELRVTKEIYNPLLKRKEINFEIDHKAQGTPQRFDVRKKTASKFGAKIDNVFVTHLQTSTGLQRTVCSVQIYDDSASVSLTVPEHLSIRNLSPEERAKRREAKSAEGEKPTPVPGKAGAKAAKETEAKPAEKGEPKPAK